MERKLQKNASLQLCRFHYYSVVASLEKYIRNINYVDKFEKKNQDTKYFLALIAFLISTNC